MAYNLASLYLGRELKARVVTQTVKKMRPTYIGFGVKLIISTLTITMGEFRLLLLLVMI